MTHFLMTEENPDGHKLEDLLKTVRKELLSRSTKLADDDRKEAKHVMGNNIRILDHLTEAIKLAEDSTDLLDRSFGPSVPGQPRIGEL